MRLTSGLACNVRNSFPLIRLLTWSSAVLAALLAAAGVAAAAVEPSKLPLGDSKYRSSPKTGWVDSCQTNFAGGQGAQSSGPWVGKSTWDSSRKISVRGSVHWDSTFSERVVGSRRVISGNGLPASPTGVFPIGSSDPAYAYDRNPNSITSSRLRVSLPADPTTAAVPACVGSTIGVSTLAVPLFGAFDALGRDAEAHEVQDACGGHPQLTGQYHFHGLPACWQDSALSKRTHLIGWALDGFGIYVEYDRNGKLLSDSALDACHGRTSVVTWDGKQARIYHYVATLDFPYLVGCYRGTPIASAAGLGIGGGGHGGPPAAPRGAPSVPPSRRSRSSS